MDFTKDCIVVKVAEQDDNDDTSLSPSYTADIKCPVCNLVCKSFYKSYEENKKDNVVILPKRWYFNNFIRHIKNSHLNKGNEKETSGLAIGGLSTTKRKYDDPKQPKISGKFGKINKLSQPADRHEANTSSAIPIELNLDSDDLADDEPLINTSSAIPSELNSDSDCEPLAKKKKRSVIDSSDSASDSNSGKC